MPQQRPNTFYFGEEEQDLLLASICKFGNEFAIVGPLIKSEYLWGLTASRVCTGLHDYHAEFGNYPTLTALGAFLQRSYGREKADVYAEVKDYIEKKLRKVDTRDWKLMRNLTVEFCRERAYIASIEKAANMVKAQEVPEGGFSQMFEEARRVGEDTADLGVAFTEDFDYVIDKLTAKTWGVRSGYRLLDENWYNGWGPGWLVVPLAPPKSYKSTFCTNLALNMTRGGGRRTPVPVFYYACEISAELTCARGYSILSETSMRDMYKDPAKFKAHVKEVINREYSADPNSGQLLVKTYPLKTATISMIRSHAIMAAEQFGVKPKVIFIDHAETILPNKRVKDASDHRQQSDIYAEAKALGEELQCVVVMPDRCNREASLREVPSKTSFQGAYEKAGVVDVGIGLCQTEEERLAGTIRYFVFVNRHGKELGYYSGTVKEDQFAMTMENEVKYEEALARMKEAAAQQQAGRGNYVRKKNAFALPPQLEEK